MGEQLGNIGYFAMKKETTKGTAVTPNVFVPLFEENLNSNLNVDGSTPIMGNKFARYQTLPGMRDHKGDVTVMAEPNTIARFFDMLLTKSSTSGSGPYTHNFVLSAVTNPNSYTIDICRGQIVIRYIGT